MAGRLDRNHARPQRRKSRNSQVARPGHDCACPTQRVDLGSPTATQPPGRLCPGCDLEPAQLAMRLLPIFFLALFSSSVLWAESPPVWTPLLAATPTPAAAPPADKLPPEASSATPA